MEMIAKVDQYLFTKKRSLDVFLSYSISERYNKYVFTTERDFTDFIERYEAVKERLEEYYRNNVNKIARVKELN